jgi:predicted phage terminase large subunit-like protein
MSGITGRSAELIIIDDPVKNRMEADSETYRNRLWEEWQNSLKTRLQANGKVILIQTRWHEDDLAGRMIANDPYVSVWRVPCEAEEGDVLGRVVGEGLCPEIGKGTDWLRAFKSSYIGDANDGGLRAWNALYQGRPSAMEGNLVKRSWFRYYGTGEVVTVEGGSQVRRECVGIPDYFDKMWQSWDCTFKDGENSDFVCGFVFGRRLSDYYLLDRSYGRMDILGTMDAIVKMSEKWPQAKGKLIEEKANGAAVISMLSKSLGGIVPVNPRESKVSRVNAITPLIQGGNVYLPHPSDAPWVREFMDEIASFPNAMHDDMVDAFSQGLHFYMFDKRDTTREEIRDGTWVYQILKVKGFNDMQIRKAIKRGVKVLGLPPRFM